MRPVRAFSWKSALFESCIELWLDQTPPEGTGSSAMLIWMKTERISVLQIKLEIFFQSGCKISLLHKSSKTRFFSHLVGKDLLPWDFDKIRETDKWSIDKHCLLQHFETLDKRKLKVNKTGQLLSWIRLWWQRTSGKYRHIPSAKKFSSVFIDPIRGVVNWVSKNTMPSRIKKRKRMTGY